MSRIATARKIAASIVATVDAIGQRGDAALIDNMWSPAIQLANSIHAGYVTAVTAEGAQYLMSVNYQLIALGAPATAEAEVVTFDDSEGVHHALYVIAPDQDARPVLSGDVLTDEDGDTFEVIGAGPTSRATRKTFIRGQWMSISGCAVIDPLVTTVSVGDFPGVGWVSEND